MDILVNFDFILDEQYRTEWDKDEFFKFHLDWDYMLQRLALLIKRPYLDHIIIAT